VGERIIDKSGEIYSTTENGLIKHVTVAAMIKQGDKILLVNRRNFPFGLCFPCGHMEHGETPSKAIKREVMEELGYNIRSKKLIFHETVLDQCKSGGDLHEWYLYDCKISGQMVLSSETNETNWINIKDLADSDIVPPARIVLSKLRLINLKEEAKEALIIENRPITSTTRGAAESAIDNLPMAIILLNGKGETTFTNRSAQVLISNLGTDANRKKFSSELSNLTLDSLAIFSEISRKILINKKIYSVTLTPLRTDKSSLRATAVIRNVSKEHRQDIKDVIAYQTSISLCGSTNSLHIIKTVLKQLLFSFNITGINLMLLDQNKLKMAFHFEKSGSTIKPVREIKIGEGIAGVVAEQKRLQAVPDTSKNEKFVGNQSKPHSLLSLPVISNNTVFGVLNIMRPKNIYFEEDEVNMAAIVANRISLALEKDRLDKSLSRQKNTLEKILKTTTDGLIMVDKDFNLIFNNDAAVKLLPIRKNDLQSHSISNYLAELSAENSDKLQKCIKESIKYQKSFDAEFISQKGKEKIVKAKFNPVIEKNNICKSVLVGFTNTTKLANKQKMVKKQVKQLTDLFKISSLSINSTSLFFNNVLKKTAGIVDSELAELYFFNESGKENNIIRRHDPEVVNLIDQILRKNPVDKEFICNNTKNHFKKITKISKIIFAPVKLQNKTIGLLYAINKEKNYNSKDAKWLSIIAERLASRIETAKLFDQTKKGEEQLEKIIDSTADGIIVGDTMGRIIVWNKAMEKITGYENMDECLVRNPHILSELDELTKEAVKPSHENIYKEIRILNFDKEEQWLGMKISFIKNASGAGIITAILRDISKERAIDDRNKEFIYTTTHELRTPITAIKGYLSMILNGDAGEIKPNQKKYFNRAYQSTENLVSLVEDILKTAQLEENKMIFKKDSFSFNKLIYDVAADYSQKAKNKNVELKTSGKSYNIKVIGDYDKTKQALSNLVDNAIKYTIKGNVTIKSQISENMGTISIEDTGVGIPRKNQEMIFTKFYRVPNAESVRAGGTGLGLFIVKNLIEKQNGKVNINSRLGKGTSISISLPLAK